MVIERAAVAATSRRRPRGVGFPWALAGVLTVAVLVAAWWQSHPTAFVDGLAGGTGGSVSVGSPMHVDSAIATHDTVTLLSVHPRVASGSPAADIELTVCGPPRISPLGAGYGDLQPYCGTKLPLVGAVLETPYDPQIVVTIRPREAGVVHIEGFDVRYRDGLQVGTQHTGSEITLTVGD